MTRSSFGVVFDMDGVLVDSADAHFRSWQLLASENGRVVTRAEFDATFGQQNRDLVPRFFGPVAPERLIELADRKEAIYRDLVRRDPPIVPGARELIAALHREGVALAVGSSGPRANIELILEALGVAGVPIAVVSGDDVTRGKPDPQVFELACRRIDLPPQRCVVIEDAPVGVAAAKAAGAACVGIAIHHSAEALAADLVVERLADITVEMLRGLAGR